ncbi:helix-turn-helix domain-containing protein [Yinghuangia soli]|uniref:Helix-turn-helix domain-containing protein n=1 Tax=Yinghuangia soli TaxID=2908204 RepID=A0AA41PXW0_9ACTN|nr:helix-turn-helix domain-containing protein [Yinghuangia soli]MCF2527929.1 helix-turn-helix domain-containing protein [Yinghuangia soli]
MAAEPSPLSLTGRQPRAVRAALAVLEEVARAGPGVTARQLAGALGLAPATAYRVINLLVADEYLVRLPDLKGFALGRRVADLAVAALPPRPPLAARRCVTRLRGRTRWGVHLAVFVGDRICVVDPDPDHPPTDDRVLTARPQDSALGRLLLAERDDPRLAAADLARYVARGRIEQHGGTRPDRACLAVPIRDPVGGALVAGLAVSAPPERLAVPDPVLVHELDMCAAELAPLLA